jgi:uncharacterized protein YbjQ (UPF0145 family)
MQAPVGRPELVERPIPVVTMEAIPGREISAVIGDVVGVIARMRELPRELRTAAVAEGYVAMLTQSRQDAVAKLVEMAAGAGADAVVGLRFDSSEITQSMSEVVAYGTAVKLHGADPAPDAMPTPSAAGSTSWRPDQAEAEQGPGPNTPAPNPPAPAAPRLEPPDPPGAPEDTQNVRARQWPPPQWPAS